MYVAMQYVLCNALWDINGIKVFKLVAPAKCQLFIN